MVRDRVFKLLKFKEYGPSDYKNEYLVVYTPNTFVGTEGPVPRIRVAYVTNGTFKVSKAIRVIHKFNPETGMTALHRVDWVRLPKKMEDIIYMKLWPDRLPLDD